MLLLPVLSTMAKHDAKDLLKKTRQRRKAEIVLSSGDTIEMYFTPLCEAEDEKIREVSSGDNRSNAYGYRVLVAKAEYEDGEKMFAAADIGELRQQYAKVDLHNMMQALLDNGGVLATQDPKSNQGSDQEVSTDAATLGNLQGAGNDSIAVTTRSVS
jgi:hypothetical protein